MVPRDRQRGGRFHGGRRGGELRRREFSKAGPSFRRLRHEALEQRALLSVASGTEELGAGTRGELVYYDYVEDGQLKGGVAYLEAVEQGEVDGLAMAPAPSWDVTTVRDNGPPSNRIDLVFVGDGYTASQLGTYATHVANVVPAFFAQSPLDAYATFFNVHRVDVISNESGVDNDPTQGIERDTALDMAFWTAGIERLLGVSVSKALAAASAAPDVDQVLAVANSTKYGGAGYSSSNLGTLSGGNSSAVELALHEFGHSFANLADEYSYGGSPTYTGSEPSAANVSIYPAAEMAARETKWHLWLDEPNVGTYEGAMYSTYGIYRPTYNSKMRSLGRPFEQVNVEQFVLSAYETVRPIDDATPPGTYPQGTVLFVDPVDPAFHDLDVQWHLNGSPIAGANDLTLDTGALSLAAGSHALSVIVVDNTPLVRNEAKRASLMTEERSWTLTSDVLLVDNGDPGFRTEAGAGNDGWTAHAGRGIGFGDDLDLSYRGPTGSQVDVATWSFAVTPGTYRVATTWLPFINRAPDAPYQVFDGASRLATVRVDQRLAPNDFTDPVNGGNWAILGEFAVTGTSLEVRLSDDTRFWSYVCADAVQIERVLVPIHESGGSTDVAEEGPTSDTYQVVLDRAPAADVVIRVAPNDAIPQVSIDKTTLTFTAENWDQPQQVTVTARDDRVIESSVHAATIAHTAASLDPAFHGIRIRDVVVRVTDNDVKVVDNGGPGFATVGDWTHYSGRNLGFGDDSALSMAGDGSSVASWTFAATPGAYTVWATWLPFINRADNAPYRVYDGTTELATVRVDQRQAPGDLADPDYGGTWEELGVFEITGTELTVTLSNDVGRGWKYVCADAVRIATVLVPIVASGGSVAVAEEGPTSDSYRVVLAQAPTADVVVTVTPDDQVSVDKTTLTFTPQNWHQEQIVTVTAVDDTVVESRFHAATIGHAIASADPIYNGIALHDVIVEVADNDVQVIDDGDAGFSTTGDWTFYQQKGFSYQDDGAYSWRGTGSDVATWTFHVPAGRYQVAATWLPFVNRASNAPYQILDGAAELATVRVDQRAAPDDFSDPDYGGTWEGLGIYDVTSGTLAVRLSDDADGYVLADAIRIERIPDAATYYVAPAGSDQNDGSAQSPLATIQQGLVRAHPGDTVVVRDGTYHESLTTVRAGTSDARITLVAENPGNVTITHGGAGVFDVRHPYLTVEGFVFDGQFGPYDVIRVRATADDLTFSRSEVRNGRADGIDLGTNQDDGSLIGPDYDFLENVLIVDSRIHHLLCMQDGVRLDAHGIVAGGVRGLEIRDSEVYYVSGDALQLQDGAWDNVSVDSVRFWNGPLPEAVAGFDAGVNPGEDGIDTKQDASISTRGRLRITNSVFFGWNGELYGSCAALNLKEKIEAVVDGNTFHDNNYANRLRGRAADAGAHVTVMNNVYHDNAVALRYEDGINHLHVYNNTFGAGNAILFNPAPSASGAGDDFRVLNNLFLAALPAQASDPSNRDVDSSSFVDAAAHDYRLVATSPAVNAGTAIAEVTVDRDGTPRPQGSAYDVGAYEFVAPAAPSGVATPPAPLEPVDFGSDIESTDEVDATDLVLQCEADWLD